MERTEKMGIARREEGRRERREDFGRTYDRERLGNAGKSGRSRTKARGRRWGWTRTLLLLLGGLLCVGAIGVFSVHKIRSRFPRIPESLLEMKQKYPEAAEFVDSYPEKKDMEFSLDVSGEVTQGMIPLFLQWDERWGYRSYGNNFFGVNGCGPTCLSMVVCGLTGNTDWNPYAVGQFSEQSGYYVPGEGTAWDLMTEGAQALGLQAQWGEISGDYIRSCLWEGSPIICSMAPGDFTYTGHFIVLKGLDGEGKVIVNDPNSPQNSEEHWSMDVLLPQISALWSYWPLW